MKYCRIPPVTMSAARSDRIQNCFHLSIASMCDVQMITGASIMIGGFICLDKRLTAHHWQFIVYLAWFSSVTHLSGLTILRRYLQAHPREKYVRLSLMLVLVIMILVAMIPTAFFNWHPKLAPNGTEDGTGAWPGMPALCFFSIACGTSLYEGFDNRVPFAQSTTLIEMLISVILLFAGFSTRSIKLSVRVSNTMSRRIRLPMSQYMDLLTRKLTRTSSSVEDGYKTSLRHLLWSELVKRPLLGSIILVRTQITLFNSMLGEVQISLYCRACNLLSYGFVLAFLAASHHALGNFKAQRRRHRRISVCKMAQTKFFGWGFAPRRYKMAIRPSASCSTPCCAFDHNVRHFCFKHAPKYEPIKSNKSADIR
ncbi:hypothetical protein CCHR01_09646 [Colletotrichum chrysophilum]|uniref:Uncharacterized protein n=1 Tax=Colletotrichum chrysophilum TaxID=1836956 RepID=A0AAD9EK62_9PEZI|nr:hypothetical protein CCHR01_09646 [Colletotrichum chrysophilum]